MDTVKFLCLLVITTLLMTGIMVIHDVHTAKQWNDGECPDCHVRYEMGGVTGMLHVGLKYYYCPECGTEVQRY